MGTVLTRAADAVSLGAASRVDPVPLLALGGRVAGPVLGRGDAGVVLEPGGGATRDERRSHGRSGIHTHFTILKRLTEK